METTERTESTPDARTDSPAEATTGASDVPAGAEPTPIQVTPKAVKMIRITRDEEGLDDSYGLRVAVRGGGCSGFEYALDFENEKRETDFVAEYEGLSVFLDPVSARYLTGTTIDYVMGQMGAGFKFVNPKATGTCGCGSSFAV